MDPNHRLHLATRIHFGLLAQLGVAVAVEDLLGASPEGREALWVCEAMDDPELKALALEFSGRTAAAAVAPRPRGEVPALHHAVAPRAPMRANKPAAARAEPAWAPTAVHGEATAEVRPVVPPSALARAPASTSVPVAVAVPAPTPTPTPAPAPAPPNPSKMPRTPVAPEPAGHVAQPTAWSRDTSGFGFSRPQDLGDAEPPPFVTTADALRPSATPPDISWATALRNRPEPAERPGWKLAFWRKS